jgi:hypothetical protein
LSKQAIAIADHGLSPQLPAIPLQVMNQNASTGIDKTAACPSHPEDNSSGLLNPKTREAMRQPFTSL